LTRSPGDRLKREWVRAFRQLMLDTGYWI